jgi:hypothetical protein
MKPQWLEIKIQKAKQHSKLPGKMAKNGFRSLVHYTNCQLLLFFTDWRDRYSGPVSASTQQQRLLIAFRWTVLLAAVAAMVPFGSVVQAQVNPTPTLPATVRFYISASGALGNGSGSSAANAADASTPAKYYAINQSQTTPGTVIMYAPGTYLMNTGCTVVVADNSKTVLYRVTRILET